MVSRFRAARSLVDTGNDPRFCYHVERLPWFQRERTLLAANARSGSDGSMSRETIEIDQAGPAKTCRLSRQVSGACDVWLKKRGLAIGREASTQMFRGQRKKKVALAEAEKARAEKTNHNKKPRAPFQASLFA